MSNKKWYNYFVVTTPRKPRPRRGRRRRQPPRRVTDIVPDADAETTFATPVSTPTDLAEIYASAQIATPAHGYTVLKVAEMLQSEHIRVAAGRGEAEIDHGGARRRRREGGRDHRRRGAARSRARHLRARAAEASRGPARRRRPPRTSSSKKRSTSASPSCARRVDQNNAELTAEQNNLLAWRVRKRQEEDRIAEAVGYFVSENPITTSTAPSDKGGSNVR